MKKTLLFLIFSTNVVFAQNSGQEVSGGIELGEEIKTNKSAEVPSVKKERTSSTLGNVLLYLPNRVFDLLDIVRLKVRVGPGIGAGFQITKPIRLNLGAHSSVWVGLPGARQERIFPWPAGFEAKAKAAASVFSSSAGISTGPDHSYSQIGIEAQAALVGLDVAIDPVEIADFLAGFFLIEIREDDF